MDKKSDIKKTTTVDQSRPFLGLRSFEEKNKSQFGGRDREITDLYDLVEDNNLTVVYGTSGIGKTSLLKAGLMPKLRKKYYFPIYIRIDYSSSKTPLNQLRDHVYQTMKELDPNVLTMESDTVWEYLHEVNLLNGLVTPVLILDQFEEIFTLGKHNKGVKEFVKELADLAQNRIPRSIKEKYIKQDKTVPSRYNKLKYRIVLSLREDYLARLDELKNFIPVIMDYGFRIVQMTIAQAMEAAIKPGKGLIDKLVAKEIIKILPGISQADFEVLNQQEEENNKLKVEPFLLSLICDRLNEKRIEKGENIITENLVGKFKVEDVISSFYEDTIKKLDPNVDKAIQEELLDGEGYRKLYSLKEFQKEYDISNDVVDHLIKARIVRKENRNNIDYLELIHDVLAPVIKKKRNHRIEEEKERQRLEKLRKLRAKNRKRMILIGSIMGLLLLLFISIAAWQKNKIAAAENIIEVNRRKARARNLIISAASESIYEDNLQNSALISKLAYGLYKKDRIDTIPGIIDSDLKFYRIMMKSSFEFNNFRGQPKNTKFHAIINPKNNLINPNQLKNQTSLGKHEKQLSASSKTVKPSRRGLRATALTPYLQDKEYGYLVALKDNTVRKLSLDSIINFEKYPMFDDLNDINEARVSSMVFDPNNNRLALFRNFNIYLYSNGLDHPYKHINVPNPDNLIWHNDPYLNLKLDESIILAIDKNLYRWNINDRTPIPWSTNMKHFYWEINDSDLKIKEANNTQINNLEINYSPEGSISFLGSTINALAISKDGLIALALNEKLILIDDNQNKIHEISFKEWRERNIITALGIDPNGEFILLGTGHGSIFRIDIPKKKSFLNIKVEKYFAHTKKVTDIDFRINKNSKDPPLVATASQDGSVAIWDTNVWSALSLDSAFFGFSEKAARKISFSKNGGYLIVAYDNGHIIRWPTSLKKIDKLICETYGGLVDIEKLTKDKHKILDSDKEFYQCQRIKKNNQQKLQR